MWLGIAVASVAVLAFGSVQTTGALWRDQETMNAGSVKAGTLTLFAGGDSTTTSQVFQFDNLAKTLIAPGEFGQGAMVLRNGGNVPLRFRVSRIGLTLATVAPATPVQVAVDVRIGTTVAACTTTSAPSGPSVVSVSASTSSPAIVPVGTPILEQTIQANQAVVLCVRSTLVSASTSVSSSYRHEFTIVGEQVQK